MARPTKLTAELIEEAKEYLSVYEQDSVVPSIAGLALHIGVRRETIHAWRNGDDCEAFSNIVEQVLTEQERKLLNGGLSSDYNASIAKLMLTKHGYTDKVETDNKTSIDLSNLSEEKLQEIVSGG